MQRQIAWTWSRRAIAFIVAAALVWALLLVVERQGGASAQPRSVSPAAALVVPMAQTAALGAASATQASSAVSQALQAVQGVSPALPPAVLAPVCAALLRARAILVALLPATAIALAIVDAQIAALGCAAISGI